MRRVWTRREEQRLRALYPHRPTAEVAKLLRRTVPSINGHADQLRLHKSAAYLAGDYKRLLRGLGNGIAHRFAKGVVPWNKGMKGWQAGGRSVQTQFKKGQKSVRWKGVHIGSLRLMDGYLQRKVSETGYPPRDWVGVHILLWKKKHGPVPKGHCVRFRDGNKQNIALENLELITRAENLRRNNIHRLPPELKSTVIALRTLRRTINRKLKQKEAANGQKQTARCA